MAIYMDDVGCRFDDVIVKVLKEILNKGIGTIVEECSDGAPFTILLPLSNVRDIDINTGNDFDLIYATLPLGEERSFTATFSFSYPYNAKLVEIKRKHEGLIKIRGDMRPVLLQGSLLLLFTDCRIIEVI